MSSYHFSGIDHLGADIGLTSADKFFEGPGTKLTVPTPKQHELNKFVISNGASVCINGKLITEAKIEVLENAKVNVELNFGARKSRIVILENPTIKTTKMDWHEHFKNEINNKMQNLRKTDGSNMNYVIDKLIVSRSAIIIKRLSRQVSSSIDVVLPAGIFDISTILGYACSKEAISYTNLSFKEPEVVAFGSIKTKWVIDTIFPLVFKAIDFEKVNYVDSVFGGRMMMASSNDTTDGAFGGKMMMASSNDTTDGAFGGKMMLASSNDTTDGAFGGKMMLASLNDTIGNDAQIKDNEDYVDFTVELDELDSQ